jgi:hypothetical protein
MTPDPEVQELLDAIDKMNIGIGVPDECNLNAVPTYILHDIAKARDKLRPKPEMEKVLPDERPDWFDDLYDLIEQARVTKEAAWKNLVTLTVQPVWRMPVWRMPEWSDLPKDENDVFLIGGSYGVISKPFYSELCKALEMIRAYQEQDIELAENLKQRSIRNIRKGGE